MLQITEILVFSLVKGLYFKLPASDHREPGALPSQRSAQPKGPRAEAASDPRTSGGGRGRLPRAGAAELPGPGGGEGGATWF